MSARKSKVWAFFAKVNDKKALCNICKAEVASSGGTTNMSTHLRRHHKIDPAIQSNALEKKLPSGKVSYTVTASASSSCSSSSVSANPWTISQQAKLPFAKSNEITNSVVYYLIQDLRPFSTIESQPFRKMLFALEPRYQPPNRHTLAEKLIPNLLEKEKSALQSELNQALAVGLTSDAWTSRSADSYLTITCHYLKDWNLQSKVLQTEHFHGSHTGENVGLELKTALLKWHIMDKVKVVTVDNASNMTAAIRVSGVDLKLGCFAHTLNLASNKALNVTALGKVLGKIRSVVTFFHKSCIGTEFLKQKQSGLGLPNHKLIMDCKTRWNSTYNMLQRFLEQRPAILATLLDERLKNVSAKANIVTNLSDSEINICEVFVKIMEVMVTATLALSEEKSPTVGLILPLLERLRKHFTVNSDDEPFTKSLKAAVGTDLATRYTDPQLLVFLEEASALDPRTKNKACVNDDTWNRVLEKTILLTTVVGKQVTVKQEPGLPVADSSNLPPLPELPSDATTTCEEGPKINSMDDKTEIHKKTALECLFDDDVQVIKEEPALSLQQRVLKQINTYRKAKQLPMNANPLEFWKVHPEYPDLSLLAQTYFCVQATSVASERVFSTSGDIVSATRSCLKPDLVDSLVFLKKNMTMP